jgi:AcrR family transcriptional regulator
MRKVDPIKHDQKRREILAAAETCFALKGFQGASIAEIRAAAGISSGHLYHYFTSKEEIVAELAELRLATGMEVMERILSGPDPFTAFLERFCRPADGAGPNTSYLLLEVLAEAGRNPAIGAMIREHSERAKGLVRDMIVRGQSDGKMDPGLDPDLAARILIGIVIDGMKALPIRNPDLPRDEAGDMIQLLVKRFLTNR